MKSSLIYVHDVMNSHLQCIQRKPLKEEQYLKKVTTILPIRKANKTINKANITIAMGNLKEFILTIIQTILVYLFMMVLMNRLGTLLINLILLKASISIK